MNVETPNTPRRRRKAPPRRTPAIIEQREQKPFIFGWGSELDRRQREALKERVALFAGIGIAVILALLLGWGWYQDNIAGPAAIQARNNQKVAVVGNYTISYALFKRFATFHKNQLQNSLTQLQSQQQQLNANPKQNSAQLAQINAQIGGIQQEQSQVATGTLDSLITMQTIFQRAHTVGVSATPKDVQSQIDLYAKQAGGIHVLRTDIIQLGLTWSDFQMQAKADWMETKLKSTLAARVSPWETKVHAEHILIASNKKPLAEQIYHKVLNGANFAALAKKYSTDPGSGKKGGDLGVAVPTTYVAPFAKAVGTMPIGSVRLVKSQFGWHIIKLLNRFRAKMTATELSTAKSNALSNWLSKQQSELHVERIMDVTKIAGIQPTVNPLAAATSAPVQSLPTSPPANLPTPKSNTTSQAGSTSKGKAPKK